MRDAADDPEPPEDLPVGPGQHDTSVPDAAAIRRALAECMTLSDVDDAMGWARGTARTRRWRDPAAGGLPPADAELGGVALWFRATITRWRAEQHAPTVRVGPDAPQPSRSRSEHPPPDEAPVGAQPAAPTGEPARPPSDDTAPLAGTGPTARTEVGDRAVTESSSELGPRPAPADATATTTEQPPLPEERGTAPSVVADDDDRDRDSSGHADCEHGEASQDAGETPSGFELEDGQHVLAYVHGAWHPAVVASRDRRTVVVDYQRGPGPLGARRQRVTIDRVRPADPAT